MNFRPTLLALAIAALALPAAASTSGVVISQVYGGGGNSGATYKNDFIELFNAGSAVVSLAGWSVQYASSAGSTWAVTAIGNISLQPGQYLLVQEANGAGGTTALPTPDASGNLALSATTGKVALVSSTTALTGATPSGAQIVDLVGFGAASAFEGSGPVPALSNTTAALRKATGCTDTDVNSADFSVGAPLPRNTASPQQACGGGGANQPIVASCPAVSVASGSAGSVLLSARDLDSLVNDATLGASTPAGITLGAFSAAHLDGDTASVPLQVAASVPAGHYSVDVRFANNEAQTASCTVDVTVVGLTTIPQIQGSGASSPLVGQTVVTRGVVTLVLNNGYFLQDPVGDGNPATSDGIFVFTSTAPTVSVGQWLQLNAKVAEFNTGAANNADTLAHTVTELTNPSGVQVLGEGQHIAPTPLSLPLAHADDYERYEGMLVTIDQVLTVSQNYFLGRYGQLTLSADGRLETPTNRYRPGTPEALALAADNARRTLLLDDATSLQNPDPIPYIGSGGTVRAGDTTAQLTGVIDYGLATSSNTEFGLYKLQPTAAPSFVRANPRSAAPEAVGGNVKVASFNVLNYFTTLNDGSHTCPPSNTADDCRGANSTAEFNRQRDKIIAAMAAIDADALGLIEVQNNGATALQNLVDGLNAKLGANSYAAIATPPGGAGTDAIKVALIYKPARLTPVGAAVADTNPIHNRPPLAQTFAAANGEAFSIVINHFKSKSGCDANAPAGDQDSGDGQGCFNQRRREQGAALRSFVANLQAQSGDADVVLLGDFNAYAQEDPIADFTEAGYVDQIGRFNDTATGFGYSYVFDGGAGRLDQALASASLSPQVTGAIEWHINADEPSVIDYNLEFKPQDLYSATPYRSSDHDPVVLGLNLVKHIDGNGVRGTVTGTPGDDVITGGAGAQTITGNGGRDVFVYTSMRDAADTITDFKPGASRIDLAQLLASIGHGSAGAIADGTVRLLDSPSGVQLQIDADGSAGPAAARTLLTLRGVTAAQIQPARDLGL